MSNMEARMRARSQRIQAKNRDILDVADRHADWIFKEIFQGDGLLDIIDDLMGTHEDADLWANEHGCEVLGQIESQYINLVWFHIVKGIQVRMAATDCWVIDDDPARFMR